MRLTIPAFHMVATIGFLDRHFADGTVLNIVLLLPFSKFLISFFLNALVYFAGDTIMTGGLAGSADGRQARGAGEDNAVGGDAVNLLAVWRGAVLEAFGICSYM